MADTSSSMTNSDLKTLATGTGAAFLGSVFGNAFVYLNGVVIGRLLGAEILGLYFLAFVVLQIANAVCRLGLPEGLLRFVAIHSAQGDLSRLKGTVLSTIALAATTSTVAAAFLFLFAEPLFVYLFKQADLVLYVQWFAIALPFLTVFLLLVSTIQALKRMDLVVLARDFIQPIIMFLLGIVCFYFIWRSALSFLVGYLASVVLSLGVVFYCLGRACPALSHTRLTRSPKPMYQWKTLLMFSLPIGVADLAHYSFRWSDTLLLSFFRSASEVGIYNAALRTTLLLNLLAVSVNALYAPIIADHHHHNRHQEIEGILKTMVRWCLTLALPVVFTMGLLSEEILTLWGAEFVAGSTALKVLAASQLIFIISNLLAFTLLMCGKQYLELGNVACVTLVNIAANIVIIPRYGITGAAVCMLLSQAIGFFLRLVEVRCVLDLRLYTSMHLKPLAALVPVSLLAATLHGAVLTLVPDLPGTTFAVMLAMGLFIPITYFAVLYLFGLEKEDLLIWNEMRARRI
jgi:O-antigen/teichoic acid export membrane protein